MLYVVTLWLFVRRIGPVDDSLVPLADDFPAPSVNDDDDVAPALPADRVYSPPVDDARRVHSPHRYSEPFDAVVAHEEFFSPTVHVIHGDLRLFQPDCPVAVMRVPDVVVVAR